jgi:hypothetical protein
MSPANAHGAGTRDVLTIVEQSSHATHRRMARRGRPGYPVRLLIEHMEAKGFHLPTDIPDGMFKQPRWMKGDAASE